MSDPIPPSEKPRGAGGQFIPEDKANNLTPEDIPDLVSKSSNVTGGLKNIAEAKEEQEIAKPLVTVSVNNPLAWLMKVINKLKKKQTTTITFRLGVPLIALPVIIATIAATFFGLGKIANQTSPAPSPTASINPTPYLVSKVGVLKIKADASYTLILPQGNTISLTLPQNLDVTKMDSKRVLVTGMFDQTNNSLKIINSSDIELLKSVPSVTPTPSLTPAPTSTPTPSPSETPALPSSGSAKEGV